jgi:excisionase family DNA binding protein
MRARKGSPSTGGPPLSTQNATKLAYSAEEAGAVLGLGRTTICRLMGEGQLRSFKAGNSRRVPTEALTQFVDACMADELNAG